MIQYKDLETKEKIAFNDIESIFLKLNKNEIDVKLEAMEKVNKGLKGNIT